MDVRPDGRGDEIDAPIKGPRAVVPAHDGERGSCFVDRATEAAVAADSRVADGGRDLSFELHNRGRWSCGWAVTRTRDDQVGLAATAAPAATAAEAGEPGLQRSRKRVK